VISVDVDGPLAPPRRTGELVFEAAWQARAFGMAVALLEREGLRWEAFRRHLIAAKEAKPDESYYEQFVEALTMFADKSFDGRRS
jgi:hypothetical protein